MGTSVLHPQDCLAAPQSDRHRRFSCVSECPSPKARPANSADFGLGYTFHNQGHKNASAGLLPLPNQAVPSTHSSVRRLAPKISPCRSGGIAGPYVSKHLTSYRSNLSSYASEMRISRCPSVPVLDHAARTQRLSLECFPLQAVQSHERRQVFVNSAQGYCMAGPSSCAAGAGLPCQKLNFLANSRFSDAFNSIRPKWVECPDHSVHYRKRMHPELFQVEAYLGRQCAKPPLKVLPDGQGESICTNTSTVGRKRGVNKQLKRSASEKRQSRLKVPTLQSPGIKEAAKEHTTSVGSHTAKCHSSKTEVKLTPSAIPKMGARSLQVTLPQQMGRTERNDGAFLHVQCYSSVSAAMEQEEVNDADQNTGIAGCVSKDQNDLHKLGVKKTFYNQLAVRKPDTLVGFEEISRSPNSVLDNDEIWASMMNDERWAGPSFFNSPPPSSLPLPSFTCKFSRSAFTVSVPMKTADYGAHMCSDNSSLQAKCALDAAFATKDLRRLLNLDDAASCDL